MTEKSECSTWIKLNHVELQCHKNVHVLNHKELLIVPRFAGNDSLWKYNVIDNNWIKWFEYPTDTICRFHTSSLNHNKTMLYVFGDPGYIITVDLKTGKFVKSKDCYHDGAHSKSLFIDGQFHIFGGWHCKSHFVWNEDEQHLIEIHKFNEMDTISTLSLHSLAYIASNKSVLIMPIYGKAMYLYSMITNQCTKVIEELEIAFYVGFNTAISVKNGQFVLCFMTDSVIEILDVKLMQTKQSNVKAPGSVQDLCVRNDHYKQEYLTFGYIHQQIEYFPDDVIQIIKSFNSFEVIHILNGANLTHWSMSVDKIIQD